MIAFERNRNSATYLALISYPVGVLSYILMPYGLKLGDTIEAGWSVLPKIGNCLPLLNIPLNIKIHAIESFPGSGAVYTPRKLGFNTFQIGKICDYYVEKWKTKKHPFVLFCHYWTRFKFASPT